MARPSMRDVAARAGVSPKTVSNVVRGWPPVLPATKDRVLAALEELDYRMNRSPEMLRSGRSGIVALAVPWLDSPYFAELTSEIVRQADAQGLTVLVDQTGGLKEKELDALSGLSGTPVDGLIFSPYALGEEDLPARTVSPLVLLGERVGALRADHVAIDNVAAALDVVTHLVRTGRRRIAAIGLQDIAGAVNARQRARGYELALQAAGLPLNAELQVPVRAFERAEGAAAMHRLIDAGTDVDAVFCFSDLLALGAMHAARERGLSVPADVAIAGFDDIEDGRYANPPLTTIRPDKPKIAEVSLALLLERRSGNSGPPREITPGYELLVRASSSAS